METIVTVNNCYGKCVSEAFILAHLHQSEVCIFSFRHLCVNPGKLYLDHSCSCLLVGKQKAATMDLPSEIVILDREQQCVLSLQKALTMTCFRNSFVAHQGIGECSELSYLELVYRSDYQPWTQVTVQVSALALQILNRPVQANHVCDPWGKWSLSRTSVYIIAALQGEPLPLH